jgi:hypothetical protein
MPELAVPHVQQHLNFHTVLAIPHLLIVEAISRVLGGVLVGMIAMLTAPTAKRLLTWPILTTHKMADMDRCSLLPIKQKTGHNTTSTSSLNYEERR